MGGNSGEEQMEVVLKDTSILLDMFKLFNNEELSDVILVVGDRKFHAHRLLMANSSTVFKTMLYRKHWPESVGEEVTLKETPECEAVFYLFIKYLYTTEVAINVGTAVGILSLADKYDVKSLKELCLSYMEKQSHVVKIETAVSWYTLAKNMNFTALASACLEAITLNTKSIIKSSMWVDLDIDCLEEILYSSEIVIDQEFDLFVGLSLWLLEEHHVTSLKENSERLLPLIRFPQVQAKELWEIQNSELSKHKESSGILHKLIGRAFGSRTLRPVSGSSYFSDSFYMPRDYLSRKVYEWKTEADQDRSNICSLDTHLYPPAIRIFSLIDLKHNVNVDLGPGVSSDENVLWDVSLTDSGSGNSLILLLSSKGCSDVPIQVNILLTDVKNRVIQSKRSLIQICQKGSELKVNVAISHPEQVCKAILLMKVVLAPNPTPPV